MRGLTIVLAVTMATGEAAAVERLLPEGTSEVPVLDPEQAVLFVRRELQVVGEDCPEPSDAGVPDDGGVPADAGVVADGGVPPADPCEPVLRNTVTMIVQPRFVVPQEGATFAVLFVTPRPPEIEEAPVGLFAQLDELTGPEVVIDEIFVEDPALGYNCTSYRDTGGGCGGGGGYYDEQTGDDVAWDPPARDDAGIDDAPMPEIVTVGPYEVVRVNPLDVTELAAWLDGLGYRYQQLDLDALAPYLAASYTVTAVRIANADALVTGLAPLALSWIGDVMRVPLGLARQPGAIEHAVRVYIAGPGRYQLDEGHVAFAGETSMDAMDGARYLTRTDLFVAPMREEALDPVAFRVPGDPEYRDVIVIPQTVRVPSTDCPPKPGYSPPPEPEDDGCWCASRRGGRPTPEFLLLVAVSWLAVRRRRRRQPDDAG